MSCDALQPGKFLSTFWRNLLPPFPGCKNRNSLKIGAVGTSEMLVNIYQIIWCHDSENYDLYSHCRKNVKCHIFKLLSIT
jgi:hypothetical protein